MAKKKSYDAYVRQQMGDLIDQLQLPNLYKQSLKERWLDQMIWADKKAAQSRKSYYRLRLTTIVGGVILPALVGISVQLGQDSQFFRLWFPPLTFLLSQVIAVSVAIEEFCKFGDRWRDYRKMAEDLKSEGWQYLQSSGPYEYGMEHLPDSFQSNGQRSTSVDDLSMSGLSSPSRTFELNSSPKHQKTHLQNYAQFANRIESIIKNDVQGYIANLLQQQAKQDAQAQKVLAEAQAVATDKTLIAQLATLDPGYRDPNAAPPAAAPVMATARPNSAPIAGAVGILRVRQDTVFKLSTQPAQALPDSQKVAITNGSAFGVMAYAIADHNHFKVTFNQGLGAENRNTWYVFAPHVNVSGTDTKPATPTGAPIAAVPAAAPTAVPAAAPAAIDPNAPIKLKVPYFTQRDNKIEWERTCNTSSCAMAAKFLDAKISGDDDYYHYVIKYGDTTDHDVQTKALQDVHIQSTWHQNLDFADLDKSLAKGLPIVIGIFHHGSLDAPTGGHMIVVIGRTAKGDYIVNDPYGSVLDDYATRNGKELTYPRHVLTCRWLTDGKGTGWGRLFDGNTLPKSSSGASSIQPMQLSQSVNTSRLTTFSATPARGATLITVEQLMQIAPNASKERLHELTPSINQTLEKYQINTPLRIAHFIAQVAHESDRFNAMEEYATGEAYEGREDLGNTEPGDGKRFKGRGLMQLTGRSNYKQFSKAMNQDFIADPSMVAKLPYAVLVAGWFWHVEKDLNPLADQNNVREITRLINGGYNGLDEREDYLRAAKSVLKC